MRAVRGVYTMLRAITALNQLGCKMAIMPKARIMAGNAMSASMMRIMIQLSILG